ncbi:phospholipase D family protein [uncultured Thiodictyon sp.]|uniref:phospholipase D family protein n=1 Tax=uncultured Thiodictyon sp. TaxID=1846217 RepID=UPI0025D20961|nr:phospholipase D family protein [uncultured Thiodictyon sp.]
MSNPRPFVTAEDIRDALTHIKPAKVAVAYVGKGWSDYLAADCLEKLELVVSPTFGSNPRAIEDIMRKIGHENVYFLDELHAKIYLGKKAAVVGSCNLSDNGLGDIGRWEVAVLLEDAESLQELEDTFANYKRLAKKQYPDKEAKLNRLRKLITQWNTAIWHDIIKDESGEAPLLRDYESDLYTIHILPYNGTFQYNENILDAIIPVVPETYFRDTLALEKGYRIKEGDWLLCWHANDNGSPIRNGKVSWLHAHHVVPHGAIHDTCTKLVGEAKRRWRTPVSPPFRLKRRNTQTLIRNTLELAQFHVLWNAEQRNVKRVNDFLAHVRRAQDEALRNQPEAEREF